MVVSPSCLRGGLRLRVVVTERRFMIQRIVIPDKLPAGFFVITAVHRTRQEPDDRVGANRPKKRRLLDLGEHLDLAIGSERREFPGVRVKLLSLGLKILKSLSIDGLAGASERRQSPV